MPITTVKNRFGPPAVASEPPFLLAQDRPTASELRWAFINREQLGVHARDPLGHKIGTNIAYRTGSGLNWYPVDRFKQTMVGTVEGYDFYNPTVTLDPDEADWNIYVRPSPAFRFIRDDVLPNVNPGDLHRAPDGEPLVECEITPDEAFYDNPWFNEDGTSPLVGETIGVYGPWVQDESHSFRPEIHPCELLWWRTVSAQGFSTWHLMVVQDDSNRFDRVGDFSGGRITRPWAAWPRRAEFRLAIRVPNNQRRRLVIEELYGRYVRQSAGTWQPGPDESNSRHRRAVADREGPGRRARRCQGGTVRRLAPAVVDRIRHPHYGSRKQRSRSGGVPRPQGYGDAIGRRARIRRSPRLVLPHPGRPGRRSAQG